jgi:uncharacterized membrane protein YhhN
LRIDPLAGVLELMATITKRMTLLIVVIAIGAIAGVLHGGPWLWLHYICKPLATLLILWSASRAGEPVSPHYFIAVLAGILLSLVGDVFLMLPYDLFVPGLVAFLLAHICYITAFVADSNLRQKLVGVAAFAAVGAANLYFLLPKLPAALIVPVLAYVAVLTTMAGLAVARAWALRNGDTQLIRASRSAAIGGALFVLSDSLLAWDKFGGDIAWSPLWVLASYYAAQWCIARSVDRSS